MTVRKENRSPAGVPPYDSWSGAAKFVQDAVVAASENQDMGSVKVDSDGLRVLAARCDERAVEVGAVRPPTSTGESFQATSAAVGFVHESLAVAREALAGRMQFTADKLVAARGNYAQTEDASAACIDKIPTAQ
jgi:hypothetical protein